MVDSVFDIALEKRFTDSAEVATINVTSADTLLIRDSETGAIMRLPFATLAAAISSAFSSSFASLVDGKVPASQLPSYVDDVLEYANLAAFPGTGETGKIYVAIDTNKTYRWSGSAYVEISPSLALGETSATAYRGDRGKTAYDHSQATGNPHGTTKADVGLSNVDNTSDANKPVSTAQQTALDAKASATLEAWNTPTLSGSWANFGGGYNPVGYYKDNFGIVHLRGIVAGGTGVIFVLPVGYRPANIEYMSCVSNSAFASLMINPNGNVSYVSGSTAAFSLDNATFRAV